MFSSFRILAVLCALCLTTFSITRADDSELWVHYEGQGGPGDGKHIVLMAGDDEYRSEESMPMLGKILAVHHGFDCTVLFPVDPKTGEINPDVQTNIPGVPSLADADLLVIAARFRELPDSDMKIIDEYVNSGKPIIGFRTATHSFNFSRNPDSPYAHYGFNSKSWRGGFGQQVLGDTWISHHGKHKFESTRGVINAAHQAHPILRGVSDVWGPTDVYGIRNLPETADVLLHGSVLKGMSPTDEPVEGAKNDPMMPLFWTKSFKGKSGESSRIVCTTMGSSTDFACEDLRRALVNSCYWALSMDDKIPAESNVEIIGEFNPTPYGFHSFTRGVKPADHRMTADVK